MAEGRDEAAANDTVPTWLSTPSPDVVPRVVPLAINLLVPFLTRVLPRLFLFGDLMYLTAPYRFAKTLVEWLRSDEPLVSQPVIEFRHMLCAQCPACRRSWFRRYCAVCLCTLSRRRWPFNKLAFPNAECPRKIWARTAVTTRHRELSCH